MLTKKERDDFAALLQRCKDYERYADELSSEFGPLVYKIAKLLLELEEEISQRRNYENGQYS